MKWASSAHQRGTIFTSSPPAEILCTIVAPILDWIPRNVDRESEGSNLQLTRLDTAATVNDIGSFAGWIPRQPEEIEPIGQKTQLLNLNFQKPFAIRSTWKPNQKALKASVTTISQTPHGRAHQETLQCWRSTFSFWDYLSAEEPQFWNLATWRKTL